MTITLAGDLMTRIANIVRPAFDQDVADGVVMGLDPTMFTRMRAKLDQIQGNSVDMAPDEALALWECFAVYEDSADKPEFSEDEYNTIRDAITGACPVDAFANE